jgi:hypothetical protein
VTESCIIVCELLSDVINQGILSTGVVQHFPRHLQQLVNREGRRPGLQKVLKAADSSVIADVGVVHLGHKLDFGRSEGILFWHLDAQFKGASCVYRCLISCEEGLQLKAVLVWAQDGHSLGRIQFGICELLPHPIFTHNLAYHSRFNKIA